MELKYHLARDEVNIANFRRQVAVSSPWTINRPGHLA
jgi:hypothetical protein